MDSTLILIWVVLSTLVGWLASARGQSGVKWTIYALAVSPLITGIVLLLIPAINAQPVDLETAIRNKQLSDALQPYVKSYKPAFSASTVYEVNVNGIQRKFKSELDALAFVASQREHPTPASLTER